MSYKIIITGATGMVGEGVLMECLAEPQISAVLSVSRRAAGMTHPKLKEYIVPDFLELRADDENLRGYDACFFCAGVSSVGMKEDKYTRITYDTTVHFATAVLAQNPELIFIYVSGGSTDSTEKGRVMWARVKGRTENKLAKMGFKKEYNFRPGFMKKTKGQKHQPQIYKYIGWMYPILKTIFPNGVSTLQQVGRAMINAVIIGSDKNILEVKDINELSK